MANCLIGFPNNIDASVLSNGAWVSTLPITNLQETTLGRVARTANAMLSSTIIDINLAKSRTTRIISLVNHNMTTNGRYRLRGTNDGSYATFDYDSGWTDVWPEVYPYPVLEWEDDRWWSGKYSQEELEGSYHTLVVILPTAVTRQYWRLELDDTSNPDGYLQAGRIFIGPAWQPSKNPSFGMATGWETQTDVQLALGGAEYFGRRTPYRSTKFTFDYLSEDEGLSQAFDLDRRAGVDKEVFWVHDPDDTVHANRRQYLGRLRTLTALEYPYFNTTKKPYEIKELL